MFSPWREPQLLPRRLRRERRSPVFLEPLDDLEGLDGVAAFEDRGEIENGKGGCKAGLVDQLRGNWNSVISWLREVLTWGSLAGIESLQRP